MGPSARLAGVLLCATQRLRRSRGWVVDKGVVVTGSTLACLCPCLCQRHGLRVRVFECLWSASPPSKSSLYTVATIRGSFLNVRKSLISRRLELEHRAAANSCFAACQFCGENLHENLGRSVGPLPTMLPTDRPRLRPRPVSQSATVPPRAHPSTGSQSDRDQISTADRTRANR